MTELLAPAGNAEKLRAALYYGADAVYMAGKALSLRAFADNFTLSELADAVAYTHDQGKRAYIACNVFAHQADLDMVDRYAAALAEIAPDGVIVSDPGVFARFRKLAPDLPLHVSTQANVTNAAAACVWAELGAKRIVLARELTLEEIVSIRSALSSRVELEAFVHGAMCVSYSGRCLLSDFMTGRHGNSGACAQCCRWEYELVETDRQRSFPVEQDARGTYILNSRDMNMLPYLEQLIRAGIDSFKIEGRAKSTYYVGCVVNAYRRALDALAAKRAVPQSLLDEPEKTGHRAFGTGFYFGPPGQSYRSGVLAGYDFCAVVVEPFEGGAVVEMRGRFRAGERLEVLSPSDNFGRTVTVDRMETTEGIPVTDASLVQQRLRLYTDVPLQPYDMLRRPK